ncbi:MAG TPA: hypothetical protein VGD78_05435 [Chthoniobacterales bacterium]
MPRPDSQRSSIDFDKAVGHTVSSLIEAAFRGDRVEIEECSWRLADQFERSGNLTAAARIRSLVRENVKTQPPT